MFELGITDWNVYYLNNYIRNDDIQIANLNDRKLRVKILNYKYEKSEIRLFTRKLIKSVYFLLNFMVGDTFEKLACVFISPSEVEKFSSILERINLIEEWQKTKKTSCGFNCSHKILNDNILIGYSNINSTHNECSKSTCEDYLIIILINKYFIFEKCTVFIVIDDITTTCTIMDVFGDILIKNNIEKNLIYKLAISKKEACR